MNILSIMVLTTLPAAFCFIYAKMNKKQIDSILLKHNSKGRFIDYVRFIKDYKANKLLTKEESKLVIKGFICELFCDLTTLIWVIIILFFFRRIVE